MQSAPPILRAERNMMRNASLLARASGGAVYEAEGVISTITNAPMRSFSQILVTAPPAEGELAQAVERHRAAGKRFRLRVRRDLHEDVREAIESLGLRPHGGIPCLARRIDAPPAGRDGDPEFREVRDEATRRDMAGVVAEAFGWAPEDVARVFTPALLSAPGWAGFVGYVAGQPAAASQLLAEDGTAGLYYIATREAYRRKGYGEAITRCAIIEGVRLGCDLATLQASPAGYPVYKRMGFEQVSEYVTYVPE